MGLIEQAVELLNQPGTQRADTGRRVIDKPIGQLVDRRADPSTSQAETPAAAAATMPCRSDLTVCIDIPALRDSGLMAPTTDQRQLAEQYRVIKRPLLTTMKGDQSPRFGNVIVVASALPGEGKTFTTINLALSLALECGREVLLVDGDVAKPHITHLFGLDKEPGFLDLAGSAEMGFDAAILRTDHPSLFVLPAGSRNLQATEILRSERTSSLLTTLASEPGRIVLIDSPPLLATSEAGVLTSLAGQVVLVVKAAHTPQEAVLHAIETITDDIPVSLVLNQADAVAGNRYAYYGQYGYDTDDGATGNTVSGSDTN